MSYSPQTFCRDIFSSAVFSDCSGLVSIDSFVQVCIKDLCHCNGTSGSFCLCKTIAEYSRQCVHAGGKPEEWRTEYFCRKYAMFMPSMANFFGHLLMFALPLIQLDEIWALALNMIRAKAMLLIHSLLLQFCILFYAL